MMKFPTKDTTANLIRQRTVPAHKSETIDQYGMIQYKKISYQGPMPREKNYAFNQHNLYNHAIIKTQTTIKFSNVTTTPI